MTAGRTAAGPELAGLAVVVVDANGERRAEAYGRAVIAPERAMTVDTPVRVASVSKLVTAIGAMRLVEQGTLDLDRDVSAYLGWTLRNPSAPDVPVTLRMLLSHTSTVIDDGGYFWPLGTRLQDVVGPKSWNAGERPGDWFSYANLNFGLVGAAMEGATGERFDRLMTRLLFAPLGIDACFNWSGCSAETLAKAGTLYRKGIDETGWRPEGPWVPQIDGPGTVPPPCLVRTAVPGTACDVSAIPAGENGALFAPQGGLRISARDLGKLARLLLREGEVDGVRLLQPKSVREMLKPQWRGGRAGETYGALMRCYGLSVHCLTGERAGWHGHLGDAYGLWSGLWIEPSRGRGYVYVVAGTADNPEKWRKSKDGFNGFEDAILKDLAR